MDDIDKLRSALKVALAEVDKLARAWDNMMPTHLEYRQRHDKFQPIRVYRMPENIQLVELFRHNSDGLYTMGLTDPYFPPTKSELENIFNKLRELNGGLFKSSVR